MNNNLCRVNIIIKPSCYCGAAFENLNHYFCECSHYLNIRTTLFNNLICLPTDCKVDSRFLAYGNDKLTHDQNVDSFYYGFENHTTHVNPLNWLSFVYIL